MATRKTRGIPAPLESTRQRFKRWRQTRRLGARIPERLWNAAVKMAGLYGMHRAASTLGVDYHSLKKRVEEHDADSSRAAKSGPEERVPRFLELAPAEIGTTECILELEKPGGAKMRVHLKGVAAVDLATLSRSLWGVDS
ncbi:MAG: hypothetical protein GWP74_20055 [Proteobacteria bacterium]|nr:hypothetical protein [Pseudomonadota bacterium]